MRWVGLALGMLLAAPALADMYQDGSNAKLPQAHVNLGIVTGCDPVSAFGADPTGATDATAAIRSCAAQMVNGKRSNIALPAGDYRVNGQIDLMTGQSIVGAGRGVTVLHVDQAFSPSASGVLVISQGALDPGAEVRDIGINFAQPNDQSSRANFQNLGTCTSGMGGTGCKYPPGILLTEASYRPRIRNVRISKAWKGIATAPGAQLAPVIDTLEMSALDTGLQIDLSLAWAHIHKFDFWAYDFNDTTNLYNGVFSDGQVIAAKFGNISGAQIVDFATFIGKVVIDSPSFWGDIVDLALDAARLEVVSTGFPGLRITNMYTSSGPSPPGAACRIDIQAGNALTQITNAMFQGGAPSPADQTMLCLGGEHVLLSNSVFIPGADQRSIKVTGSSWAEISGNKFLTGGTSTVPVIDVQGGSLRAVNNHFSFYGTNVGSINIANDSANHYISNNNTDVWPVTFGFGLGGAILGYYDLGNQPIGLSAVNASFDVPGTSVFTSTAFGGFYYLRGDYVEGELDASYATNAYTGASGPMWLKAPNMPTPKAGAAASCVVNVMDKVTITSMPMCSVFAKGFTLYKVNSGAVATSLSTAEVPPSVNGVAFRLGWRYRIR
jgi:hypothetical protein